MILDSVKLGTQLAQLELSHWSGELRGLTDARLLHGNLGDWEAAIEALPACTVKSIRFDTPAVTAQLSDDAPLAAIEGELKRLSPWRKGPFRIGELLVDSEWRSDWKWQRIGGGIAPLAGRRVLDVGCGNGYYAYRMLGAGAASVLGVDPTLLFLAQFKALSCYLPSDAISILPLRVEELPRGEARFDTVFSMGVLYHQRSPIDHLRLLKEHLKPAGELVLETLILPGDEAFSRTPPGRYARMRNVWALPTIAELGTWLLRSGFEDVEILDISATTTDEQRATEWMTFESLREALDPEDATRTIEGWPAPRRAALRATPRQARRGSPQ